ncbi:hypothetical protein KZO01_26520 [Kurthia zopfii]|uniref:YtzI protein n=1 Tax=Kurthia zopfii TaxID=1650 RepID=A0A8B4QCC4_9BACL|nr:hypothetical protein [Kurthia zopfii]TDR34721.1 hypothetical protein DFR61_1365 [Kurthia zopfii]GEK32343.1 hypothetical protein KZO01_26520 [Kurthia zopfii]STX10391.1 Uncharacterised protein [Kurthia zopfii]VEI08582.1 Uncharacterised protein [Kurthia zopfii]
MNIAWVAILPVALLTIALACFLIFYVIKNSKHNTHKTIDPKPTEQFDFKKDDSV